MPVGSSEAALKSAVCLLSTKSLTEDEAATGQGRPHILGFLWLLIVNILTIKKQEVIQEE